MALLDLVLGYDCNLACDYCTITPQMRTRALPTAAVVAGMRRGRELGYDAVQLTGGEPTIRADLLGLVRAARKLGYDDVKLQTNGLVFAEAANVTRAIDAGVTRFSVSVHTHDARHYDALVRRDGAHAAMVAALDNLIASGATVSVDLILKTDTVPRLCDAVQWLHGRGVRDMSLWFVSLTDGNRDNLASMPRMSDAVPAMKRAFAWCGSHDVAIRSLHVPRCLLGDAAGHAFDPGAQRVMVVTPEATFELADSKLTPQQHVPACAGCEHESYCPGVRPDYIERYGDEEIAHARGQQPRIAAVRALPTVG